MCAARVRALVMRFVRVMRRLWRVQVCVAPVTRPRLQVSAVVAANAIPALMAMMSSGAEAENGVSNAMSALHVIFAAPEGRDAAVAAGVPAAVVTAMAACDASSRGDDACILSSM